MPTWANGEIFELSVASVVILLVIYPRTLILPPNLKDVISMLSRIYLSFNTTILSAIHKVLRYGTKKHIIETKILPYFGKRKLDDIRTSDVIQWQNEIMKLEKDNGELFSQTYAFEMLYWTGIREGELLALTPADFNFEKKTLRINKSYQRLEGEDVITDPKTPKSNRTIVMPDFLAIEMEDFIKSIYGIKMNDRIFTISKSYLHHEMDMGVTLAGVKRIRIHGLRHSHISLLINLGFSALAIGERVRHEAVDITYHYAHLFPTVQTDMAAQLETEREALVNVRKE